MGYSKAHRMSLEACEELKAEARDWLRKHKVGASRLSLQADVKERTIKRWLEGDIDRLHIVAYARIWLVLHPENTD